MVIEDSDPSSLEVKERPSNSGIGGDEAVILDDIATQDVNKYPHGINLTCIVIALLLTMFLASLDLVGNLSLIG